MKKLFLLLGAVLSLGYSLATFAADVKPPEQPAVAQMVERCKEGSVNSYITEEQYAKRGCCSWHQGVCGCQNGRVVCCDGSLSPSCTCSKEDPPVVVN